MPRTLSSTAVAALNAQETSEVFLVLLTVEHADLVTPIRVVNNNEDVTSNGNVFTAFAFALSLPPDDGRSLPSAQIEMDNVDQSIIDALRPLIAPPQVTIQVVLASSPNTVELEVTGLSLVNVEYDIGTIRGQVSLDHPLNNKLPAEIYDPGNSPNVFRAGS